MSDAEAMENTWKEIFVNVIRITGGKIVRSSLSMKSARISELCSLMILEDKSLFYFDFPKEKVKILFKLRCLCLASYVDEDCIAEKNENITDLTYFLNLQMSKTHPKQEKNFVSQLADKNLSLSLSENQLLKELEQKIEVQDIFNVEIKKATEFLNSIKPNYQQVLSEYQDFFGSFLFFY